MTITLGEIAQLLTSVATLIYVVRMGRKVEVVHKATNSLVTQLVNTTAKASDAEGHARGLEEGMALEVQDDVARRSGWKGLEPAPDASSSLAGRC